MRVKYGVRVGTENDTYVSVGVAVRLVPLGLRSLGELMDMGVIKGFRTPTRNPRYSHRRVSVASLKEFCRVNGVPFNGEEE